MCKCCEEIEFWKEATKDETYVKSKLFAKITIYSWRIKEPRMILSRVKGRVDRGPFKLNYCPECGKEIKQAKRH
jgi:hypothetical protein